MGNETTALLALTMGDPCGVGPEIIVKSLAQPLPAPCVVVGDVAVMRRAVAACDLQWPVAELDEPEQARQAPPRCVPVW
jgi:4-hydroxythreonine-4-phosphate dehydrogenase